MKGEFTTIARIIKKLGQSKLLYGGIGHDAAIIKLDGPKWLVATCDSLVEDTHFRRSLITPKSLGRKAACINISDIAAVGGEPKFALVTLGLPVKTKIAFVDNFYDGLKEELDKVGVIVVGGNLTRSKKIIIDVTLIGWVAKEEVILRSGAKINDYILVTGRLGQAKVPQHRLREARILAKNKLATAMIDISDGFSQDLGHLCQQSQVGAQVFSNTLPSRGEDYELLFTADSKNIDKIKKFLAPTMVTVVGKIKPQNFGYPVAKGWDHFR